MKKQQRLDGGFRSPIEFVINTRALMKRKGERKMKIETKRRLVIVSTVATIIIGGGIILYYRDKIKAYEELHVAFKNYVKVLEG